jgi:hypothetical protein
MQLKKKAVVEVHCDCCENGGSASEADRMVWSMKQARVVNSIKAWGRQERLLNRQYNTILGCLKS